MKIQKITPGFVVQTYDTKTGRCIEQSFIAGEDTSYEDQNGDAVDWREEEDACQPFEMVQPMQGAGIPKVCRTGLDLCGHNSRHCSSVIPLKGPTPTSTRCTWPN